MWGCLGGMLITTSYFLDRSHLSGFWFSLHRQVFCLFSTHIVPLACLGLLALAFLNIIGIRESATVALVMAATALTSIWMCSDSP